MIKWYGDNLLSDYEKIMDRRLKQAGLVVVGNTKRSFGSTGIPGATKKQRRKNRSKPGEPPHIDTGSLKRSITTQKVGNEQRVGSNLKYARALELGYDPNHLLPRPYLRPGLAKSQRKIREILTAPIK